MKKYILLLLLIIPFFTNGQSKSEKLVKEGIALHDAGKYDEAIKKYNKALKIDKNSSLINYELGYAYFAKKEYKKAIKYLDKVIKKDEKHLRETYMTKASCLDYLKKPQEAITLYNKAIKEFPEDNLLYYNLALTQYNINDEKGAEQSLINAVSLDPTHSTSNLLLGMIKLDQSRKVESFLALNFFLLVEPNTKRSQDALQLLKKIMQSDVEVKDDKNIEINIDAIALGENDDFMTTSLMLSLLSATNMSDENKAKSSQQLFFENTESIFKTLEEQREGKEGVWWDLYVDFYSELVNSEHTEAYCYFITQSNGAIETTWMEDNKAKMDEFYKWVRGE